MTSPSRSSQARCAERSTQAAVPEDAAAVAQGTLAVFGFTGVVVGPGFEVEVADEVGDGAVVAGAVVVVAVVVVGVAEVVAGALDVVGTVAPAATAPPPVTDVGVTDPPEHAASTNAPAAATAASESRPARTLFTITYPQRVHRAELSRR